MQSTFAGMKENIVAFDIETEGLHAAKGDGITVVCFHSKHGGETFNLKRAICEGTEEQMKEDIIRRLNDAPCLTAFNGIRFDIPFIQHCFGVKPEIAQAWIDKTFDIHEICFRTFNTRIRLNSFLLENGFQPKSGMGLEAINWARNPAMWGRLEEYCADDARLTWLLACLECVKIPFFKGDPRKMNLHINHALGTYEIRPAVHETVIPVPVTRQLMFGNVIE